MPADEANLETEYTEQDITDVSTKNEVWVSQTASSEYTIHQYQDYVSVEGVNLEWEGQTNLAPSTATVKLEIFNENTQTWDSVDEDSGSNADTDFILTGDIADLTDYKNGSNMIACRIYQLST